MVRLSLSLIASTIVAVALPLVSASAQKPQVKEYGGPLYVGTDFKGGHYEPPVFGPRDRRAQSSSPTAAPQAKKPVRAARAYAKASPPVTAVAAAAPVVDTKAVEAANAATLGAGSPVAPQAAASETNPTITSPMVTAAAAPVATAPEATVKTDGAFAPTAAKADEPTPAASTPTIATPAASTATPSTSARSPATTALIETSSLRQSAAAVAAAEPASGANDKAGEFCSRYMPTIGQTISVVCR